MRIQIDSLHGRVSLNSIEGLLFETGNGTLDERVVFYGTLSNINKAILDMTYVPSLNFNTQTSSGDFVRFFADDMGNCGVGGFEISEMMYEITYIQPVNDAPVVTVPGATRVGSPCRESSAAPHDHHEVSIHENVEELFTLILCM